VRSFSTPGRVAHQDRVRIRSEEAILAGLGENYARSWTRTSENSYSTHSGE
jgi:hypothetical protein